MHNPFNPRCGYCLHFVYSFPATSRLSDWGYCALRAPGGPPPVLLRQLEAAARAHRYDILFGDTTPVFQVGDDGCAAYEPAPGMDHHSHGADAD